MNEQNAITEATTQLAEGYQAIEDGYLELREQAQIVNHRAVLFVQEHPVACISGAVAVGYLVGTIAKRRWLV